MAIKHIKFLQTLSHTDFKKKQALQLKAEIKDPKDYIQIRKRIRNDILKCKDVVNSIYVDEEISLSTYTNPCDLLRFTTCDPNHKLKITEDVRIKEQETGKSLEKRYKLKTNNNKFR